MLVSATSAALGSTDVLVLYQLCCTGCHICVLYVCALNSAVNEHPRYSLGHKSVLTLYDGIFQVQEVKWTLADLQVLLFKNGIAHRKARDGVCRYLCL